ncbi:hypothetical protein ONZ45_g18501 [Pleurotus djamor]|nr:hypothetical protein ONZ45_g18501 [Pleurotus djamor]
MVALYFYLASLACVASFVQVTASPVVQRDGAVEERGFGPIRFPPFDPRGLVCKLPIIRHICPRGGSNDITRLTSIGLAHGVLDPDGAHRFVAKYASASRWQPSTLASTWTLP